MKYILISAGLIVASLLVGLGAAIKYEMIPHSNGFIGSTACFSCHITAHEGWSDSLHPRMMRSVSDDSVIADLTSDDLLFKPAEAIWVIGSKWEQQFMGSESGKDTLLPGRWMVDGQHWDSKNWDGIDAPEPLRRCHGCHTVGLNVDTGEFVEPGISCESCHGMGQWHQITAGLGKIVRSNSAEICGQCHSRGRTKDQQYYFPVGYEPGNILPGSYELENADFLQNSSSWWGNGSERRRHQEYNAWLRGGHSNSLKSIKDGYDGRFGEVASECLNCHEAEHSIDSARASADLLSTSDGITCTVCHNVHGKLDELRMGCDQCHTGGAYYHQTEDYESHVPEPVKAHTDCVSCHMPLTVQNGGGYTLHSHAPGVVEPRETIEFGVPNSCQNGGCHTDTPPVEMQVLYRRSYPN